MSKERTLVLASVSPRRKELMAMGGWRFEVMPAGIGEDLLEDEKPRSYVLRMAESKARAVSQQVPHDCLIIGADTTVVGPQGEILVKPQSEKEAFQMLLRLQGHTHQVLTAVVVMQADSGMLDQDVCVTDVLMRAYTEAEIHAYIATGDPFDKAGGYAIQHKGFDPVERIQGCFANVVGLPVCTLARLLEKQGFKSPFQLPTDSSPNLYEQCLICDSLSRSEKQNPS